MKTAKFDVMQNLGNLALGVGVTGLISAFTLEILADTKTDMTANSYEANATQNAIEGVAKVPAKLGTVATVGIAVFIISLLLVGFAYVRGNQ